MSNSEERLEKIRESVRAFPTGPGLYFMKSKREKVLYIGKAKNLRSRVASYFQPSAKIAESRGPKILEMLGKVVKNTAGVRRPGAPALDQCNVAARRLDGFWE